MAEFINIVHPDLEGQMGRVPRASFPSWAESGWTIAADDDAGPSGRSRFVDEAKRAMADTVAERTAEIRDAADVAASKVEADAVAAAELVASQVAESIEAMDSVPPEEDEKPKPKPKPKSGSKTGSKT